MRRRFAFIVIMTIILSGCQSDAPTPLLGDILSRHTQSDVRQKIGPSASSWTIVDKLDARDFDYFVARVSGITDMGHTGEAEFEFFNDQLVSVTFFPETVEEYKEALEREGVRFEIDGLNKRYAEISPNTEVFFFPSDGSFRFADRTLARVAAETLSGER